MGRLFKISLALLPLGFLAFAGIAFAQMTGSGPTVTLHGDVEAAYGIVNWGETDGSQAIGKAASEQWEADEVQLRVNVTLSDQLTAFANARFWNLSDAFSNSQHATPGSVPAGTPFTTVGSTVFAEVHWKAADSFEIDAGNFDYPLWSAPMTQEAILFPTPVAYFITPNANHTLLNPATGKPAGVVVWIQENMFLWNGIHGVDFNYQGGPIQYGIGLSPQCTGLGINSCQNANQATYSIVPHIYGVFGDLKFNAQIDSVSGTVADSFSGGTPSCTSGLNTKTCNSTVGVSSLGWAIGAAYQFTPIVKLALDVQSWDIAKETKLAEDQDQVYNNYGARLDIAGLMIQYFSDTYNPTLVKAFNKAICGSQTCTNSVATLRYAIPTSSGIVVMPEIKSETFGKLGISSSGKAEDVTNTQADVILRDAF